MPGPLLRWLPGTLILASIVAGIVLAVAGQHALRWSPPPVPPRTMTLPAATTGPAVFYNLGRLRRGDLVYVTLADRRTGLFRVYAAELYAKSAFPPAIYGPTWWPTLRLITCGGRFDPATGHYLANTVVFAEYVGASSVSPRPRR